MTSNSDIADANARAILTALNRYGYLRVADITKLVWGWNASDTMCRRTTRRLRDDKLVDEKRLRDGCLVFALSVRGANVLRKLGLNAHATRRLLGSLGNFEHRCLANVIAIYYEQNPENQVLTEFQIQSGLLNLGQSLNKLPDYFVITPEGCIWGEVERSRRSNLDWIRLMRFLKLITTCAPGENPELNASQDLYLLRVEFVCTRAFEAALRRRLASHLPYKRFEERSPDGLADDFIDNWIWFRHLD
ncbi:MAG: hypothetical protein L6Q60_14420 [Rhodocyclaceae bacterium]|nr:hypothetical protein [Rhodocyclaceae bacterium]